MEGGPEADIQDYVGQSGSANYTVLEGDGWIGLIMEETVRPPSCLTLLMDKDADMQVRTNRSILPTMVVPPRWRDGLSLLHPFTIHERNR